MSGLNLTKFFRKAVISGMALTSIFGAPLPKIRTKEDSDDGESRIVEEDGVISSEDLVQGQWCGWDGMDNHLYRYESLENLVSHENEKGGKFWKTATLSGEEPSTYTIKGVRSDDVPFSVSKNFDIRDKHIFDQLCQEFNKKLTAEIV